MLFRGWGMDGLAAKTLRAEASSSGWTTLLMALEAVGMPLHRILPLAEQEGMPIPDLVEWTDGFLNRVACVDDPEDAVIFVFGCVRRWESLLPRVLAQGPTLLRALLLGHTGRLESLATLRDADFFQTFRTRVLRRLGYPTCLAQSHRLKVTSPRHLRRVMAWLATGGHVFVYDLELRDFQGASPRWGVLHAPSLVLKNGATPSHIDWIGEPADPTLWHLTPSLQLERVTGLRTLGGSAHGTVSLEACPDLEALDGPFRELRVVACPRLGAAWLGTRSRRMAFKHCAGLHAIRPWSEEYPANPCFGSEWIFEVEDLDLEDCPQLRSLPARLRIQGRLRLSGVGPIEDWPWDFQVGGDFLLSDCPTLESLPAVEVQGSLVVLGDSGLRRLSPGTVIGRNLDLRACARLEDFPRGVKVGGSIYLPEHLNHRRKHLAFDPLAACELPEVATPDLYEDLRTLLKALRFPDLVPMAERLASRELAAELLFCFQSRVAQEPRFEALLLWTASEVWRELAEEAWAVSNPMASGDNESDDDLPMAWLLSLLKV